MRILRLLQEKATAAHITICMNFSYKINFVITDIQKEQMLAISSFFASDKPHQYMIDSQMYKDAKNKVTQAYNKIVTQNSIDDITTKKFENLLTLQKGHLYPDILDLEKSDENGKITTIISKHVVYIKKDNKKESPYKTW